MEMYARIINKESGLVEVGDGDINAVWETDTVDMPDGSTQKVVRTVKDFYEFIGMELMEVEQAYNGAWYIAGKAPVEVTSPSELVDFITAEADKIAYGGITIVANGQEYLFKTTTDNITRCNAVLAMFEVLPDNSVIPWEVWQGDIPTMLPVNKEQFKQCFAFGSQMIISVETVKGTLNASVQELTEEQLADANYVMAFKENAVIQFSAVNTVLKLEV